MKTLLKWPLVAVLVVSAGVCFAQATAPSPAPSPAPKAEPTKRSAAIPEDPGERAFATHCGRCHNAPESLPPAVTGTVVRHMRVRANLSAEEARLILGFLAP